jgi:hypothetical protein
MPFLEGVDLMRTRRRHRDTYTSIALVVSAIIVLFLIGIMFISTPKQQAQKTVNAFYSFEQRGEFASSWSLFHSSMQAKFQKVAYIQDRPHVFMNHFGVETFTFQLSKPKKIKKWKISEEALPLDVVYGITVVQTFESKYGRVNLSQNVFAVKEKGHWRVLWDINE